MITIGYLLNICLNYNQKMINKYFAFFFSLFIFHFVNGQIKLGVKPLKFPFDLVEPTGEIIHNSQLNADNSREWIVYSDRENNQTFTSPGGKITSKVAGFMKAFWVIEENNEYLRVVEYDHSKIDLKTWEIDTSAIDYGWISKKNLLLWNNSLIDTKLKFSIKSYAKHNIPSEKIWSNPALSYESNNRVKTSRIYFVFKTEGNSMLISENNSFEGPLSAKYKILGWVNINDFIQVRGRLCIEVNNELKAINERKEHNLESTIFSTIEEANDYKQNANIVNKRFLWQNNVIETIPFLQNKKFHVFDVSDNIAKVNFNEKNGLDLNQITEIGFAPVINSNLKYPLFKYSIFLTDDEFTKLNEELKQFELKTYTGSEGRIQLQKVFKQIVQTYLGSEAKKRIKTIQLGEVMGLITGLSSTSSLLSKYKIEDLTNYKVLNNSEFTKIAEYILNQSQKLQEIKGKERNKFRYQVNNGDYYWVPAEYMP